MTAIGKSRHSPRDFRKPGAEWPLWRRKQTFKMKQGDKCRLKVGTKWAPGANLERRTLVGFDLTD